MDWTDVTAAGEELPEDDFTRAFDVAWAQFEHTFYKHESRQDYSVPDEPGAASLRSGCFYRAVGESMAAQWEQKPLHEEVKRRGQRIVRTRVVDYPLTAYTKFELLSYVTSVALGEEIRIVEAPALQGRMTQDFLLFDDNVGFVYRFGTSGEPDGGWRIDAPEALAWLVEQREFLVGRGVPLGDFKPPEI